MGLTMCTDRQTHSPYSADDQNSGQPRLASLAVSLAGPIGVAIVAAIGCLLLVAADPTTPGGPTPPCPTELIFGINCPGCGASRMIYSLLHLDIVSAIQFNAVGVVAVGLLMWSWFAWLMRTVGKRMPVWTDKSGVAKWVLVIVIAWTIIRLLPFEPFRSLQV